MQWLLCSMSATYDGANVVNVIVGRSVFYTALSQINGGGRIYLIL